MPNLRLIDTVENKTIEWINEHDELLDGIAQELHDMGREHHYAFDRESLLLKKIVDIAYGEITRLKSEYEDVDTEVRSYIANRMHDRQWVEVFPYKRSLGDLMSR